MKKIIIAVSMLAAAMSANAQEAMTSTTTTGTTTTLVVPVGKYYKPVAGDVLAEIGLFTNGLVGANVTELSTSPYGRPQLKFRYFLADQLAVRVGFNYSQNTNVTRFYEAAPGSADGYAKDASSLFGINLGVEKHFKGTGRLSTYAGGDISFQKTSASAKWENSTNGTTYAANSSRNTQGFNTVGNVASTGFGLRAFAGADYYFVENVYLGAEFGWGFIASKNDGTTDEVTVAGVTAPTVDTKSTGGSFNLLPSLNAGLRLGFKF